MPPPYLAERSTSKDCRADWEVVTLAAGVRAPHSVFQNENARYNMIKTNKNIYIYIEGNCKATQAALCREIIACKCLKTSLLHRLQAQTLPDEAPPVGKIYLFSKIAVTFELIQ